MNTSSFLKRAALSAVLMLPQLAQAVFVGPPSSSAGVVERQIEKEVEAKKIDPEKEAPQIDMEIPEAQLDIGEHRTVYIDQIVFSGNTVFSSQELQKEIDGCIHCEISMKQIREICQKIQDKYVRKGYFLARVYPPEQKVENKTLTIHILEGELGEISVEGNKHYKSDFIKKYFTKLVGRPIRYEELIDKLLLLNDNTDLDVAALLKKGKDVGQADLVLRVYDKLPVHLYLSTNNYGSSVTTLHRSGGRLDYGNCLFQGDTLSVAGVFGSPIKDLQFTDAIYKVPLNTHGTAMQLSYLYTHFHVNRLHDLHLKGISEIAEIRFDQACLRTRRLNIDAFASFDYKKIKNIELGSTASDDELRELGLGCSLDYMDHYRGRNLFDVRVYGGIPNLLGGLKAVDSRSSREGAGGRFFYMELNYKRIQQLPWDSFLLFNFSGQGTFNKLPIAEQFYIGGVDTVRGYSLATGLGDNGYYTNLEARIPLFGLAEHKVPFMKKKWKEFLQFVGFVDHGGVFLNGGGENQKHTIFLTSAGVGFRVYGPYRFDLSFDVGFPLTEDRKTSDTVLYFKVDWRVF